MTDQDQTPTAVRVAERARRHGLEARAEEHRRHGWVCWVTSPLHDEPVLLRDMEDLKWLRLELAARKREDEREDLRELMEAA